MMHSLLDILTDQNAWNDFRACKTERNQLSKAESEELDAFIAEKRYLAFQDNMHFSLPQKRMIAKRSSQKKRTVYCYSSDETWILKMLAWQLYIFDPYFSDHLYSFRRDRHAGSAFRDIRMIRDIDRKYVLKLDIHDYFNSIHTDILLSQLKNVFAQDEKLYMFFRDLLEQDACIWEGQIINEKRGAMAGVPISGFLADVYLTEMDRQMEEKGIPYFRYSDDMILFFDTEEEMNTCLQEITDYLGQMGLILNEEKQKISEPGEPWEFLGFRYERGEIDLAQSTVEKMKRKIRRKAKKFWRRRKQNHSSYDAAARSMIRSFDSIFYDLSGSGSFTWTRFYFPLLTRTDGLHEIDTCMIRYLRYLKTGKHNKGNYAITYEHLKKLGYTPLVAEYYRWKEDSRKLAEES